MVLLTAAVEVLDSVKDWEKVVSAWVESGSIVVDSAVAFSIFTVATEAVECSVVDGGEVTKLLVE